MTEQVLVVLALALLLDRFIGEPDWLWRRFTHPVVWFGRAIESAEKALYPHQGSAAARKRAGVLAIAILVVAAWLLGGFASRVFDLFGTLGLVAEVLIVAVLLAQKSLAQHVGDVAAGLRSSGLEGGRKAVSMIVGRDPKTLDRNGVSRAAIESLAENASDGVVAPALFYAGFGLSGLLAYKVVNTADSMIGHKTERYRDFGWGAARLDDLFNLVPARLTGLLACLAFAWKDGRSVGERAFAVMRADARLHRSPNSGWPESAFAGGLDVALGGPRIYAGDAVDEPYMNDAGRKTAQVTDIDHAIEIFWAMCAIFTALVAVLSVIA